ncbi:hypothetical protein [Phenylobacterium sp.]|jgi:hypothetical protein|uniref:beta strand repeat-containing protein n=1 Tax=Phenylobacterium sp. TaxID=1871053 RepID=UPI002F40C01D
MVTSANQSYVLGLFNTSNTNSFGIISLDLSSLATTPISTASLAGISSSGAGAASQSTPPAPPWNTQETAAQSNTNVQSALAGQPIMGGSNTPQLSTPDPTGDYTKLFSLYQGLTSLEDIATAANTNKDPEQAIQLENAFQNGLSQVSSFVDGTTFKGLRLADGTNQTSAQATLAINKPATTYTTAPLTNSMTADVPAFDGNVQFNINVTLNKKTTAIPIDLSNLGSQPRSISNVVIYINQQLKAAGVETRVALDRIPGQPQTITAAGTTVTLPAGPDQFAMQVNIGTSETVSFDAPQTANAVYVGETVGNPDPDSDPTTNDSDTNAQLVKIQTDTSSVPAAPQNGQANYVPGQVFTQNLGPNIGTVHATQVGPDGSVYVLADVSGTVNNQTINGTQDVALLKYDSAGNLIYTRTLGDASTASGLSLAVSSTGQVAVAGQVTGELDGSTDGALNSGATGSFSDNTDSFVTLYDNQGNELWTSRRGSRLQDQASSVAFSADGSTVYVAGQAQGVMPGGSTAIGGYDGYVEGLTTDPKTGAPKAAFTQTFGTTSQDQVKGMVVDGNTMITASVENGHAILRNFDLSSGTPVQQSTRDLGDLQGGTIAGLSLNGSGQVVVAGTTTNGALNAGTVTSAASGGTDAFAAQIDENLADSPNNDIAYYGGSGDDRATGLAVSNGQVWITGTAGTDLPNLPKVGKRDGFVANINIATGAVGYSTRFSGKDGMTAPTSIAVDSSGASVLDKLGLPKGVIGGDQSQQLTSQSSLRAGDSFTVGVGNSPPTKITIDPGETLSTLATKIQRATGFEATATVTTSLTGQQQLSVKPAYPQAEIVFGAGPASSNALAMLGLPEGVLDQTTFSNNQTLPADGGAKIYGLGLSSTLNLNSAPQIAHAQAVIAAAQGVVRQAYKDLVAAANPPSPAQQAAANNASANNPVPTYLTNELANLQAGLARLTGGSGSASISSLL